MKTPEEKACAVATRLMERLQETDGVTYDTGDDLATSLHVIHENDRTGTDALLIALTGLDYDELAGEPDTEASDPMVEMAKNPEPTFQERLVVTNVDINGEVHLSREYRLLRELKSTPVAAIDVGHSAVQTLHVGDTVLLTIEPSTPDEPEVNDTNDWDDQDWDDQD